MFIGLPCIVHPAVRRRPRRCATTARWRRAAAAGSRCAASRAGRRTAISSSGGALKISMRNTEFCASSKLRHRQRAGDQRRRRRAAARSGAAPRASAPRAGARGSAPAARPACAPGAAAARSILASRVPLRAGSRRAGAGCRASRCRTRLRRVQRQPSTASRSSGSSCTSPAALELDLGRDARVAGTCRRSRQRVAVQFELRRQGAQRRVGARRRARGSSRMPIASTKPGPRATAIGCRRRRAAPAARPGRRPRSAVPPAGRRAASACG